MTIEDIENYIIRYNIDKKDRSEYYIFNRMYLYAILFYKHQLSLEKIGKMFKLGHVPVRNALIEVHALQNQETFQKHVKLLTDQYYFIVPQYKNKFGGRRTKNKTQREEFHIKIKVTKRQYLDHLKDKDSAELMEIIWKLTLKTLKV